MRSSKVDSMQYFTFFKLLVKLIQVKQLDEQACPSSEIWNCPFSRFKKYLKCNSCQSSPTKFLFSSDVHSSNYTSANKALRPFFAKLREASKCAKCNCILDRIYSTFWLSVPETITLLLYQFKGQTAGVTECYRWWGLQANCRNNRMLQVVRTAGKLQE
jgi:hypothetical protein